MTKEDHTPLPKRRHGQPAQTGAERQRGHRQRNNLRFLEVTEDTYGRLAAIRILKDWTIKQVIEEAMILLERELEAAARSAALAEAHKRAVLEEAERRQYQAAKPLKKPRTPKPPELEEDQGRLL